MATLDSQNQNPQYWQTLKDLKNEEKRIAGVSVTMEEWVMHFKKLLNEVEQQTKETTTEQNKQEKTASMEHTIENYYTNCEPMDAVITEMEVRNQITKNKNNKAIFLDNVSSEILKYAGETIIPTLTQIFDVVLSTGIYPRAWKSATLTPGTKRETGTTHQTTEA